MSRVMLTAVLALALVGGTGCAGGNEAEPAVVAVEVAPSGEGRFELTAPRSIEAGLVRLEVRNRTKDDAFADLLRLDDGHSIEEALKAVRSGDGSIPAWMRAVGGVGFVEPGAVGVGELVLAEGRYHLVDVGEPAGDDVRSHAENGATAVLEVTAGDSDAELPDVDASIEMGDYNFIPTGLRAGTNRVRLANIGEEVHHTLVVPIRDGATWDDVREFATSPGSPPDGPPPLDFSRISGTSTLDPGRELIAELELAAGRYAFVCFISDREGGPPHVAKGMLREVTISDE